MKIIGIIPARIGSTRLPRKALIDLCGLPMIVRVYKAAAKWDKWDDLVVATDSEEIIQVCAKHGITALMTDENHGDCLDRAHEISTKIDAHRYIIIQGDEALFDYRMLENVDLSPSVINFYTDVSEDEVNNPNIVKVVINNQKEAVYFSRFAIPYQDKKTKRKDVNFSYFKQLGCYILDFEALNSYTILESGLENAEGIGLLRFIEYGIPIHMEYTPIDTISIDTKEDKEKVIRILKNR